MKNIYLLEGKREVWQQTEDYESPFAISRNGDGRLKKIASTVEFRFSAGGGGGGSPNDAIEHTVMRCPVCPPMAMATAYPIYKGRRWTEGWKTQRHPYHSLSHTYIHPPASEGP